MPGSSVTASPSSPTSSSEPPSYLCSISAGGRLLGSPPAVREVRTVDHGGLDDEQRSDPKITGSRGHLGVVGDSATRLVEPDPPLPGKPRCGQRRGERRFGRPIARAKAPWRTGPGHPADMAAPVICCPKRPQTPSTASRRPVIYTPGGRLHECAGGIMHADRFRSASPLWNPHANAAGGRPHPLRGVPYTRW